MKNEYKIIDDPENENKNAIFKNGFYLMSIDKHLVKGNIELVKIIADKMYKVGFEDGRDYCSREISMGGELV